MGPRKGYTGQIKLDKMLDDPSAASQKDIQRIEAENLKLKKQVKKLQEENKLYRQSYNNHIDLVGEIRQQQEEENERFISLYGRD